MPNQERHKSSHVQSVGRALQLLELLAAEKREMSLTEISKKVGWPKSTVHGLLATLRGYDVVEQSAENGHYRLGMRLFELGTMVAQSWDIRTAAKPAMLKLNAQLGETVQLATDAKGEVLYLEKIESTHLLRIVSEVGARLPMHCSGVGKVLLAYKTNAEVKWIISQKGLPALTTKTITTLPRLQQELTEIQHNGYGFDNGEIMEGVRCVAAPIRDVNNRVRYAISVSGMYSNMQGERLEKIIQAMLEAAATISRNLGYRDLHALESHFF